MDLVKTTIYLSIFLQIISLVYGIYVYQITDQTQKELLSEIMWIENVVQFVEFAFYFTVAFIITNISLSDLAKYRYIDWFVTTPLMLITTMLFFIFEKNKTATLHREKEQKKNVVSILNDNKTNVIKIVIANALMLLVGYLQEINMISLWYSNIFGFGFLAYSFYVLYTYVSSPITQVLFWVMFFVWSLYGVASNYNNVIKNTAYNLLDVVSKNFYGIFLASVLLYT